MSAFLTSCLAARTQAAPTLVSRGHRQLMEMAVAEAARSQPAPTAYCVGCVIVPGGTGEALEAAADAADPKGGEEAARQAAAAAADRVRWCASGFSRERPGNTHAEEVALAKLVEAGHDTAGCDLYTSMEPCSKRLSGKTSCVARCIEHRVGRVFIGVREPDHFVRCEGVEQLLDAGIEVFDVDYTGLREACFLPNLHIAKFSAELEGGGGGGDGDSSGGAGGAGGEGEGAGADADADAGAGAGDTSGGSSGSGGADTKTSTTTSTTRFADPSLLPLPRINYAGLSATEIEDRYRAIEADFLAAIDRIASGDGGEGPHEEDPFDAFSDALAEASTASTECCLPALVSSDADARAAGSQAKKDLRKLFERGFGSAPLFQRLSQAAGDASSSSSAGAAPASAEARYRRQILDQFARRGLSLESAADRARVAELSGRIAELEGTFEQNINEDLTAVDVLPRQLAGCPAAFVAGLPKSDSNNVNDGADGAEKQQQPPHKVAISMKAPVIVPVMKHCADRTTRKTVQFAAHTRCPANEAILEELVCARDERARLLGYASHVHFSTAVKMAGTPEAVLGFLDGICGRLDAPRQRDFDDLSELMRRDAAAGGGAAAAAAAAGAVAGATPFTLESFDVGFYSRQLKEARHAMDEELIREHFPLEHVREKVLEIYQHLLGLEFRQFRPGADAASAGAWHEDVEAWAVLDAFDGTLVGHFFLDLFSRPGKFGHQCVVSLVPSHVVRGGGEALGGGRRVHPVCAILGNMTRSTADRPSLLSHREVHTFFHEFGHVMHAVLSRVDASLHAWNWPMMPWPGGVENDYLEVPSMFLEQLVYREDVLGVLSKHYKTGKPLPTELVGAIASAKHFLSGLGFRRFLAFAYFDMVIHGTPLPAGGSGKEAGGDGARGNGGSFAFGDRTGLSYRELWAHLHRQVWGFAPQDDTHYFTSWYHLAIGYDAGYYGYLWSEVFAYDVLTAFDGLRVDSPEMAEVGMRYRRRMLEPCASQSGMEMIRNFLGREPNDAAFVDAVFGGGHGGGSAKGRGK